MNKKLPERVPTNLRLLLIMNALANQTDGATVAELGAEIGLPRQTVHRLCATLIREGYLIRDSADGRYRPGRQARTMASAILNSSSAHIARHQVLEQVAEEIGETINFVVPEDQGMSYKDRVETNWALRIQLPVGSHVPFHCTASGKVFLASLRKAERNRMVNVMSLPRLTPNTHTDPQGLSRDLVRIARQGYAIDNEEFMEGMIATAVPVTDNAGRYFASLAFHAPLQRISLDDAIALAPTLNRGAEKIRAALFDAA